MAINDFLEIHVKNQPGKIALWELNRKFTFGEIGQRVHDTASILKSTGVESGNFICLSFSNVVEFIYAYFAILKVECVPVLINPTTPPQKIAFMINDVKAKGFIGHSWVFQSLPGSADCMQFALLDKFPAKRGDLPGIVCYCFEEPVFTPGNVMGKPFKKRRANSSPVYDNKEYTCIYTSGTTGTPKGVMLSYGNVDYSTSVMIDFLKLTSSDRSLISIPFTHCAGLLHLVAHIRCGGSIVTGESPALPGSLLKAVKEKSVTNIPAVPSLFTLLVKEHRKRLAAYCSALRFIEFSSAPYISQLIEILFVILPGVNIYNTYGLTEAPRTTYHHVKESKDAILSVGKANRDVSLSIINREGKDCLPGEKGEIYISGPNISAGYWHREDDNRKAFTCHGFKTGDIGYKDHEGRVFLAGRNDDMIKVGAERVYPEEIEKVIGSMPGVSEVIAYGVEDKIYGEVIHVKIVRYSDRVTREAVLNDCRKRLEKYKLPEKVEFCRSIPKSDIGKVMRKELRLKASNRIQ